MTASSISNSPNSVNTIDGDVFVTPDGRVWSCYHGVHGFVVEQIIDSIGLDGAAGSLLLLAEGLWLQEQATGAMTDEQRESIKLLAEFPDSGIKTAAIDILTHFAEVK